MHEPVVAARKNMNLTAAKKAKMDEFYTRLTDVEKELMHYTEHFADKTVYCNCDDPRGSAFFRHFVLNFNRLGLKRLITTNYTGGLRGGPAVKIDIREMIDYNGDDRVDLDDAAWLMEYGGVATPLIGDGDFRSPECVALLKQADIVVTNPPFSLFREYIAQLMEYGKKFVIIGNKNAVTYKDVFKFIKEDKLWVGYTPMGTDMLFGVSAEYAAELAETRKQGSSYRVVDGVVMGRAQACWFTNLDTPKRHEKMYFYKRYSPEEFPKYDNYDAINVDKVAHIPEDYDGVMGVPITFLDKYNPEQFEILGDERSLGIDKGRGYVYGKRLYSRIFIRRREQA